MTNNEIYSFDIIDNVEYVSFDIFDTIIKREISKPENLFKYVELIYNKNNENKINDFFLYRINAERIARKQISKEEVTIDQIYDVLKDIYNQFDPALKQIEIEAEKNFCTSNEAVKEIYNYAIKKGKKVLIISDFYLSSNILSDILKRNGMNNYKELFVSCEIGLSKKTGNLFKYILEKYNIKPNNIVHIGDHPVSDNKIPNSLGIKTIKVANDYHSISNKVKNKFMIDKSDINEDIIDTFIKKRITKIDEGKYYKLGYSKLGILYYGFLKEINEIAIKKNCQHIYFFSRDGYILKEAYRKSFSNKNITSSYFYISRRAIVVPSLIYNYDIDQIIKILGIRPKDTVKSFFNRVGLKVENYDIELSNINIDKDDLISKSKEKFNRLYEAIRLDIVHNAENELEVLEKYLKQEKMNEFSKVLIVDIGWRGSMQYSLEKIVKKLGYKIDIYGAYLGLNEKSESFIEEGMKSNGYIFSKENNYDKEVALSSGVGLIESLFLAPHGSVIGYREEKKKIYPILDEYEYSAKDFVIINEIQKGAMKFVEDFYDFDKKINIDINNNLAFNRIEKFIKQPENDYMKELGDLAFADFSNSRLAQPKSIWRYLIKPKEFKNELLVSQWKICFLKRLFKINLPYFKIYKFLRKKFSS